MDHSVHRVNEQNLSAIATSQLEMPIMQPGFILLHTRRLYT